MDGGAGAWAGAAAAAADPTAGDALFGLQGLVDLLESPSPAAQKMAAAASVSSGDVPAGSLAAAASAARQPVATAKASPPTTSASSSAPPANGHATCANTSRGARVLRVEVQAPEKVTVRMRYSAPPSRFTKRTTVGKRTGPESTMASVHNPAAGTWYVTVSSVSSTSYTVAASLATSTPTASSAGNDGEPNPALYGTVHSRPGGGEDDDWEVVDCTPASPTVAVRAIDTRTSVVPEAQAQAAVAAAEEALTQQTDLLYLSNERLQEEIGARGGGASMPTWSLSNTVALAGILFPLLPPGPPLSASASENQHPAARGGSSTSVDSIDDADVPRAFVCPITCEVFSDPVFTADGMTYEREAIATWLKDNRTSPLTNARLPHTNLVPNFSRARLIKQWRISRA